MEFPGSNLVINLFQKSINTLYLILYLSYNFYTLSNKIFFQLFKFVSLVNRRQDGLFCIILCCAMLFWLRFEATLFSGREIKVVC